MQIWTGKFCLFFYTCTFVAGSLFFISCSSTRSSAGSSDGEVSIKEDQKKIDEMRKDIPEETRKTNDRLGEMLKRWRDQQMAPDRLREKFSDEIRKMRTEIEKRHKKERDDFTSDQKDKRRDFQDKQKEAREDFLSAKPKGEKRQEFISRQSEDRDRFNSDTRDKRDEFEERIRDERKEFESDIADRWSEFREEFPEYTKAYNEMKAAKERKKEESRNGAPVTGAPPPRAEGDVNRGGDGWPATDPSELNDLGH